jgi:intracellular sulfur oxidation DsrE/DsrF family protein
MGGFHMKVSTVRRLIAAGTVAAIAAFSPLAALADAARVAVAIHVDSQDPATMNLALNNANNIISYYESQGEEVTVEIVTYGPGLHMLRADTSPVIGRISQMSLEHANLTFSACQNTLNGMQSRSETPIVILDEAQMVPSGAVRLIELQGEGYAYLRP